MRHFRLLFLLIACLVSSLTSAEQLFMARVKMSFPEAMLKLQDTIKQHGYSISRVQRVDIGLTKSGYKTDKYRVVFYGKPEEYQKLLQQYPLLQAYFPLKIAIFAEDKDTLITAYDPHLLFGDKDPELSKKTQQWASDLEAIFRIMREAED